MRLQVNLGFGEHILPIPIHKVQKNLVLDSYNIVMLGPPIEH